MNRLSSTTVLYHLRAIYGPMFAALLFFSFFSPLAGGVEWKINILSSFDGADHRLVWAEYESSLA
jgi:hypothetical protein